MSFFNPYQCFHELIKRFQLTIFTQFNHLLTVFRNPKQKQTSFETVIVFFFIGFHLGVIK